MTSPISATASTWQINSAQNSSQSGARANVLKAVSTELGITPAQLQSQLQSGKSLSQVASAAGVSSDQLNATITSALKQSNLPAGTDLSALATRMANHVGGHHHHHGGGTAAGTAPATSAPTAAPAAAITVPSTPLTANAGTSSTTAGYV
jgi:hypothetical protein